MNLPCISMMRNTGEILKGGCNQHPPFHHSFSKPIQDLRSYRSVWLLDNHLLLMPDITLILFNGTIRRELANIGNI